MSEKKGQKKVGNYTENPYINGRNYTEKPYINGRKKSGKLY